MKVIVVGAGIIGALTACQLARRGAEVTIVDAAQPATAASGASFGWINASFYLDADHFDLRRRGMNAHRRLMESLHSTAYSWQGCLCWENEGVALEDQYRSLCDLGYPVRLLEPGEVRTLEPALGAPKRALYFKDEGAVDLPQLTREALAAAAAMGAKLLVGVHIDGVEVHSGTVRGLRWSGGVLACDKAVLAGGTGVAPLLAPLGVDLPMLDRSGLILRSAPLPPMLAHILVTPEGELRQDLKGRILAPTAAAHQSDTTEAITEDPRAIADRRAAQISDLFARPMDWQAVSLAARPVPGDGHPVMGAVGPAGLHVAVMHSGATLAAIAAERTAAEVLEDEVSNSDAALLVPYRPQRFTG